MPNEKLLDTYEDCMTDMAAWIQAKTWGGHEADCPAFGFLGGECSCIKSTVDKMYETIHAHRVASLRGQSCE